MHIHHSPADSANAGIHSAAAAEKSAAAARATQTRSKLLKSSAPIEAGLDAQQVFMISAWSEGRPGSQHERQAPRQQSDTHTEEEEFAVKPISIWA